MTIKEVEKKLNITRANIRFYEKEGLLQPKRCDNEYRDYSEDDLKRLEKILLFRKCNISIENIISQLDDTEKKLIELRYFKNLTQSRTADILGMTQVQVSRKEKKLLLKMREKLME